jgi:acetyl esterase/lipase
MVLADLPAMSDRPVVRHPDQVFSKVGGVDRLADVVVPASGGPFATIIYLHGGGWRMGDRRTAPDLTGFAARGFATVSIDYRLSGEAIFPAALEDVKTAIRWVRKEAVRFGFDAGAIGLWGASAGGHLAAMAALTDGALFGGDEWPDHSSKAQAVVDGYGPSALLEMDAHREPGPSSDPESPPWPAGARSTDANSFESAFLGAPIATIPDRVAAASPVTYAHASACPFLLIHGPADTLVPVDQSERLYAALATLGNDVELGVFEGLGHAFFNRKNLDDAGPRKFRFRHSVAGVERAGAGEAKVLDMVARFFGERLRTGG